MSDPIEEHVKRMYDTGSEREWERMDRHRTEFTVTLRALEAHLPPPPARLLDCGGGPGRFAIELAQRGYEVTLFDLSAGNLGLAREKADAARVSVEVMGDLERREGSRWVPTRTRTEATVTLDGIAVRVPWLEEATPEAIRRGRLERAAHYLPRCDPSRLTALLRGERKSEVL